MSNPNASDPQYFEKLQAIAEKLKSWNGPIFVAAHEDPDGDAIGSVLGCSRSLKKIGLDARAVATSPRYLEWLPKIGELLAPFEVLPENALILSVDSAESHRTVGVPMNQVGIPIINIDHHGSNPRFGESALIVQDLINALGVTWDVDIATPVLTGILTDTGNFRFSNTSAEVLHASAELMNVGANITEINEYLAVNPRSYYKLQAEVLSTIDYPLEGLLVTAYVNEAMLERVGATWEEVESMIASIRNAEGTQIACIMKDFGDRTKLSLRSRGQASAQNIAIACGGGGHVAAAGATLMLPFPQAKEKLLEEARKELTRVGLLK
jgi:bifunctional oligoribonuclease and PAP phosphatase NrnA